MSSLSFGIVFALMAMWVVLWGILGAVISSVRGTDLLIGVSHGTSLGPFGILMLLLDKKNSDKKKPNSEKVVGITTGFPVFTNNEPDPYG
jgi:hypothetical protein